MRQTKQTNPPKKTQTQGIGGLYWGFIPFLLESFPYDCTELGTYSQLHDVRKAAAAKNDATGKWVSSIPDQVWDLAIGAGETYVARSIYIYERETFY